MGTLAGLIREFQQTAKWRRLAESTKAEYRRIFTFWEDQFGTCPYPALEDKAFRRAVIKWHDQFSEEKPREADNRVTVLARVLSWATRDGPLKRNVMDGFERAYQSDRSDKIWLPEHVDAFMAVASPEMKLAMVLALHTGQRRGDLTGHSLRRAQDILDKYLARTSTMADNAIAKFENALETNSAKRAAKQERQNHAK